jgi:thiol-disulfide isomerase/thioredoxin
MKKLLILSLFVGQSLCLNAQIEFEHGAFAEAKQKATKENKLIFIDAFTVWCGPCKQLAKNIFPLPEVGEYFNKNFINVKIDMEKGEGIEMAKQYAVNAYPTLLFVNAKGELVHRTCGLMPKESLLEEATKAVSGSNTFVEAQNNKSKINGNPSEALKYFQLMDNACAKFDKDVDAFFASISDKQLADESTDKIIASYITNSNNKGFEYIVTHKKQMSDRWGEEKYNAYIKNLFLNEIENTNTKNKAQIVALESKINQHATGEDKIYLSNLMQIRVADQNNKKDEYAKAAITFVNKYGMNDANLLNNYAWSFYEKVDKVEYLQQAEKWAETCCSMQKADWHALDTYAAVLFKLKKKDQAATEAQKAISLGKRLGEDVKDTEALLEKINQLQ